MIVSQVAVRAGRRHRRRSRLRRPARWRPRCGRRPTRPTPRWPSRWRARSCRSPGGRRGRRVPARRCRARRRGSAPPRGGLGGACAAPPTSCRVLAQAGVVDAGGRGLVLLLDALGSGRHRAAVASPKLPPSARTRRRAGQRPRGRQRRVRLRGAVPARRRRRRQPAGLRAALAELGDSLVVVGTGDGMWNVHVHVNDVGAAIEAGVEAGRPHRITVVRFADQSPPHRRGPAATGAASRSSPSRPGRDWPTCSSAEGVTCRRAATEEQPVDRDGRWPAILAPGRPEVIVLPNARSCGGVAEAAADAAREPGIGWRWCPPDRRCRPGRGRRA